MASSQTPEKLMCINMQMLRTSHWVLKTYDDAYRPYGIKATQLPVLSLIAQLGPITVKRIADETLTERSVLSRKLQVMEENGWVARQTADNGTREQAYVATATGMSLLEQIRPVRLAVQERLLSRLDSDEQRLLLALCDKLRH